MCLVNIVFRFYLILIIASLSLAQRAPICNTTECRFKGLQYYRNLKTSVNPCDNFYKFACGDWMTNFEKLQHVSQWGVHELQAKQTLITFRDLLTSKRFQPQEAEYRMIQQIFQLCSNIPRLPRMDARQLASKIQKTGRPPKVPLWVLHERYLTLTGESILFHPIIIANPEIPTLPLLLFCEPLSAYGSIVRQRSWTLKEEIAYQKFLFVALKSLQLGDSDRVIKEKIKQVFMFRIELDRIIRRNRSAKPNNFQSMTPDELQRSLQVPRKTFTQDIPWKRLSNVLLNALSSNMVNSKRVVGMRQNVYFYELLNLLGKTSAEIIGHHMEIFFVERHLIYSKQMFEMLDASISETNAPEEYVRVDLLQRWEECLQMYNKKDVLVKLYMNQRYPRTVTPMVHELLQKIKAAMKIQMKQSTWLIELTRKGIEYKLDTLIEWIGAPPWYTNPSISPPIDAEEVDFTVPIAYLNIDQNRIFLSATMLTPPIFEPNIPQMYNIAGIGSIIGHELYHITGDCGTYSTHGAGTVKNWWADSDRRACAARKMCFLSQYGKMTEIELKRRYGIKLQNVNAMRTFPEDYADVMGLAAAYMVFENEKKRDPNTCATLPQFPTYNCEQMFFVAFANQYCENVSPRKAMIQIGISEHSMNSVRVNAALANNPAFAKAFQCPRRSPMNPDLKCDIWK